MSQIACGFIVVIWSLMTSITFHRLKVISHAAIMSQTKRPVCNSVSFEFGDGSFHSAVKISILMLIMAHATCSRLSHYPDEVSKV